VTRAGKEDVCMGIDMGFRPKSNIGPACVIQGNIPSTELLAHNNKSSIDRKYRIIVDYSPSPRKPPMMAFTQSIAVQGYPFTAYS